MDLIVNISVIYVYKHCRYLDIGSVSNLVHFCQYTPVNALLCQCTTDITLVYQYPLVSCLLCQYNPVNETLTKLVGIHFPSCVFKLSEQQQYKNSFKKMEIDSEDRD